MNSNVTYLSSRSVAVYEVSLIEQFVVEQIKNQKVQAVKLALVCFCFTSLASLAALAPVLLDCVLPKSFL